MTYFGGCETHASYNTRNLLFRVLREKKRKEEKKSTFGYKNRSPNTALPHKGGAHFPSGSTQKYLLIYLYTYTPTHYIIQIISKMARRKASDGLGEMTAPLIVPTLDGGGLSLRALSSI